MNNEEIEYFLYTGVEDAVIKSCKGIEQYSDEIVIETDKGTLKMFHAQDCCEHVTVEDFELDCDLTGAKIKRLLEISHGDPNAEESATWTFYRLETDKGDLWLRWIGESNGYYSETVTVVLKKADEKYGAAYNNERTGLISHPIKQADQSVKEYFEELLPKVTADRLVNGR